MPPKELATVGWMPITVIVGVVLAAGIFYNQVFLWLLSVVAILILAGWVRNSRIAGNRRGEDIGTFARSIEFRKFDPWSIRAVYEEFSEDFPIRANDSFEADLGIDPEDLECRLLAVAKRSNREMAATEQNPYFGEVKTVYDLLNFLQAQPKLTS